MSKIKEIFSKIDEWCKRPLVELCSTSIGLIICCWMFKDSFEGMSYIASNYDIESELFIAGFGYGYELSWLWFSIGMIAWGTFKLSESFRKIYVKYKEKDTE